MYITREKEAEFRNLLKQPEIVAVVGPRQAGKTTMIEHVLKSIPRSISYSFDNPDLARQFKESPDAFYERYMKDFSLTFLDEIQFG